jgi:hypothetical protein
MDHRIGMRARLDRDGKLKLLEGYMRNKAQDKLNQQGRDEKNLGTVPKLVTQIS